MNIFEFAEKKNSKVAYLPTLISISLLKEACKAEKSEFVKILVKNGSRLVFEGNNDKVNDLYILKLMVVFFCFSFFPSI